MNLKEAIKTALYGPSIDNDPEFLAELASYRDEVAFMRAPNFTNQALKALQQENFIYDLQGERIWDIRKTLWKLGTYGISPEERYNLELEEMRSRKGQVAFPKSVEQHFVPNSGSKTLLELIEFARAATKQLGIPNTAIIINEVADLVELSMHHLATTKPEQALFDQSQPERFRYTRTLTPLNDPIGRKQIAIFGRFLADKFTIETRDPSEKWGYVKLFKCIVPWRE